MSDPASRADEGVQAARIAVRILELLASHEDLGVTEAAHATQATKARVYRHLRTLVDLGYAVQRESSDRYLRGPKLLALARTVGQSGEEGLIELARPVLQRLHNSFDHTFNLSLTYGDSVSIVESLPGKALVGIVVQLNQQLPLHSTAAGKLLLADRLKRGGRVPTRKLARYTGQTIVDPAQLRQELMEIDRRGWADAPEQVVLGINAVSVPVFDQRDALLGMISAMDSIQFIPADPPRKLVEALLAGAREVSGKLAV